MICKFDLLKLWPTNSYQIKYLLGSYIMYRWRIKFLIIKKKP